MLQPADLAPVSAELLQPARPHPTMIHAALQNSAKRVSRLGLGCMGMSSAYGPVNEAESLSTLALAIELGVNFFDTSDFYAAGANERLLGRALKGRFNDVVIATKCGLVRGASPLDQKRDSTPAHIRAACEASLQRLGCEAIDLYYLHRLDDTTPIEDSMGALADLAKAGKIVAAGLSEVSARTVGQAHKVFPVAAVQNEYSLLTRPTETEEVIDLCQNIGALFVPYSPISRGLLTGAYRDATQFGRDDFRSVLPRFRPDALPRNLELVDAVAILAAEKYATPVQLALAWLLAKSPCIMPIPGTRRMERLRENVGAIDISLTPQDIHRLEGLVPAAAVHGARYPALLDKPLA